VKSLYRRRCSTACTPLRQDEVQLRQRVKCVTDKNGYALYFSRGMLPHNKDGVPKPYPPPFQVPVCVLSRFLSCRY
jgi:3-deoxy-manno-octulosonate cytidylyltransferase (CMP-KDO synthetase)